MRKSKYTYRTPIDPRAVIAALSIATLCAISSLLIACQSEDNALAHIKPITPAFAETMDRPIRVLLARGASVQVAPSVKANVASSTGESVAVNVSTAMSFKLAGGKVDFNGKRSDEFTIIAAEGYLGAVGDKFRGKMRVVAASKELLLINVIDVDEYLRGVVPAEVPHTWPIEAIKAQAVAARTYAIRRMMDKADDSWDVVATTADQVYGGVGSEQPEADQAIAATAGEVLVWEGEPIVAYYSADAGGYTKQGSYPYLQPVPSPAPNSPYSNWEMSWSPEEFREMLDAGGMPSGAIVSIEARYDDYGRCQNITFATNKASFSLSANDFRKLVGVMTLRSTMFHIDFEGGLSWTKEVGIKPGDKVFIAGAGKDRVERVSQLYIANAGTKKPMKGSYVALGQQITPSNIKIKGSGFGHGTGMSQWGAHYMASEGKSYREILLHYYTGVTVVQIGDILNG